MSNSTEERELGVIGDYVEMKHIEHYIIGSQTVARKFVRVLDKHECIVQSDLFRYPISLADLRVKLKGKDDSVKVAYERIEDDTIQLTVFEHGTRSERYRLPDGKAFIIGEAGELQLPVLDIGYGYVSISKLNKDVTGIKPYRVELNTSIGVNVVSEILRIQDRDDMIVFELAVDLEGWMRALRRRAEAEN